MVEIHIGQDYTVYVGDAIKLAFFNDDKCHGKKGKHLTGVMMGFAPDVIGNHHDYRALITTTIPLNTTMLNTLENNISKLDDIERVSITVLETVYQDCRANMGMHGALSNPDGYFGRMSGIYRIIIQIDIVFRMEE
jgi:hypothetical protein